MPKKYINRVWRNWKDSETGVGAIKPTPAPSKKTIRLSTSPSKFDWGNFSRQPVTGTKITSPKNIMPNNFNSQLIYNRLFGDKYDKIDNFSEFEDDMNMGKDANLDVKKMERIQKDINLGKAKSAFDLEQGLKIRRLSTVLANVIAKLAEDQNCEPVPGDDEWNIDDLLMRKITKMPVNACRQSRERSNIVLMLDSSPSCKKQSAFYSSLAIGAVGMNVLDVYDAPNCKVIRKFNYRTKRFEEFMSKDEVSAGVKGWDYIKGRTVLFFGDYDGSEQMEQESNHNKVFWFNPDFGASKYDDEYYLEDFSGIIYCCKNDKDFIEILKKLK